MKKVEFIFYENKRQQESLSRFIQINSFDVTQDGIILKGQYVRGIPFQDETTNTHYTMPGMMTVDISCKKAIILSPIERNSSSQNLMIFAPPFLSSLFTLCFEYPSGKYYEVKCKDFYISRSEGFYDIDNKYISVAKYREMQRIKSQKVNNNVPKKESGSSGTIGSPWTCSLCDGDETTGCLWHDPTECPNG